MTKWNRNYIHD